ncbi:MAG: WXG100 family type VII secretion target [bacterium]|nr:WXG100 family type VII secretion target [bacterium]
MTDRIEVDYAQLQKIQQILQGRLDELEQHYNMLVSKTGELGQVWKGKGADKFSDEMETQTLPAFQRLGEAIIKIHNALSQIANLMRAAEEQAGNLFKSSGLTGEFPIVSGGFGNGQGVSGGGTGGGGGRSGDYTSGSDGSRAGFKTWIGINKDVGFSFLSGDDPFSRNINMGNFPSYLKNSRFSTQTELLRQYLGGNLSFGDTKEFLRYGKSISIPLNGDGEASIRDNNPSIVELGDKDRLLPNYFEGGGTFEVAKLQGEATAFERLFGNENANLRFSALSVEGELSARAKFGKDGIDIGAEANAGAYLARLQGSAEMNGFKAQGDAYIGATASGQGGLVIDPMSGDAKFTVKGEAFIGAEAKGSIGTSNEFFSLELQGSASVGAGLRGQFDVGIDDGVLKVDIGLLGALGVGGGAGVKLDVNLNNIADVALDAIGDAIVGVGDQLNPLGNFINALMP